MLKLRFPVSKLKKFILKEKIVTKEQMKIALGTKVYMTVFRKLKGLNYRTSYSHGGKYYTLEKIISFNEAGLWEYRKVLFSIYGTLIETVQEFVNKSDLGFSAQELETMLKVQVRGVLLNLFKKGQINRGKFNSVFIYFSTNSGTQRKQIQLRKNQAGILEITLGTPGPEVLSHELKASIVIFFSLLNEQQKRLYAGLESMKAGYGGDKKISELLGIHVFTVAKGRRELLDRDIELDRIRKAGGGRSKKKTSKPS